MAKNEGFRRFGSVLVGEVPWGTHLCQFYENKEDLIDILVPYFAEGLRNNEFCMWVTSPPLETEEAREALSKALPNLDEYFRKGQIEIISYDNSYLLGGRFDPNIVLQEWVQKEKDAIQRGFDGVRLSGNTFWIEQNLWSRFADYEETLNAVIGKHKMITLCTYCMKNCRGTDVVDVVRNHVGTLIKHGQKWSVVEDITERKKLKDILRESEERFLFALKKTPVVVANLDRDLRFTWVYNPQAGNNSEDLIGKEFGTDMNFEDMNSILACLNEVISKGTPARRELRGKGPYGERVFESYFEPKRSAQNEITGVSVIAINITERKKAESAMRESEQRYYTLFSNMEEGFLLGEPILDRKGNPVDFRILDANSAFEKQTGLKIIDLIGKTTKEALPGLEESLIQTYCEVALTSEPIHFENYNNSTQRYYEVYSFSPTKGRFASLFNDITERVRIQDKLKEYGENLEKLVEERTKQLKDSERLAAIGTTAGMVGHDIRNPLQAITSDVYLAKTELASISESDEKKNALESLQEIEKNIEYINKIVADLQDFARPLNPHVEVADLKLIIDELLKKNGLPENVKVSVKVESEARVVLADSTFINRILYNLVNNAVQAMPIGGKLTMHVYKEANDAIITVKDTGVGIPEKVRGKLFTPMFTTKAKGQGFGLAVIKRMTEALGGTVTFESQEGKGTTFIVRLPPPKLKGKWVLK